ncbi:uncharacterized protein N7525_001576 [Penicillium rubens]|uniref:uncharacterized protein n=1 Tax=Penicillium rubens TaxID=1108849 RepID=UPI002A5A5B09|nr:uncharacterized protein N7525_001576 [Penicillium rubens]KAJ5843835.1 hypothetical protein N7525_001576 [Penicillium rubens]KAJ5845578.1 hypothetical protein N7534_009247 [Penicillium rubens]
MESTAPTPRPPVDVSAGRVTRFRHVKLTSKFQYDLHSPNLDSFAIHFNGTVSMLAFHWEDDFALCGSIQGYSRPPATTALGQHFNSTLALLAHLNMSMKDRFANTLRACVYFGHLKDPGTTGEVR